MANEPPQHPDYAMAVQAVTATLATRNMVDMDFARNRKNKNMARVAKSQKLAANEENQVQIEWCKYTKDGKLGTTKLECHCWYRLVTLHQNQMEQTNAFYANAEKAKQQTIFRFGNLRAELLYTHTRRFNPESDQRYGPVLQVLVFQILARNTHPVFGESYQIVQDREDKTNIIKTHFYWEDKQGNCQLGYSGQYHIRGAMCHTFCQVVNDAGITKGVHTRDMRCDYRNTFTGQDGVVRVVVPRLKDQMDPRGFAERTLIALCPDSLKRVVGNGPPEHPYNDRFILEDANRVFADKGEHRDFYGLTHKPLVLRNEALITGVRLFHLGEFSKGVEDVLTPDVGQQIGRFGVMINRDCLYDKRPRGTAKRTKGLYKACKAELSGLVRLLQQEEGNDFAMPILHNYVGDKLKAANEIFGRSKRMEDEDVWVANHGATYCHWNGANEIEQWERNYRPGVILLLKDSEEVSMAGVTLNHCCDLAALKTEKQEDVMVAMSRWLFVQVQFPAVALVETGDGPEWTRQARTTNGDLAIQIELCPKPGEVANTVPCQRIVSFPWGTKQNLIDRLGFGETAGHAHGYVDATQRSAVSEYLDQIQREAMEAFVNDFGVNQDPANYDCYMAGEVTEVMFDLTTAKMPRGSTATPKVRRGGYEEYKHIAFAPSAIQQMEARGFKVFVFLQPVGGNENYLSPLRVHNEKQRRREGETDGAFTDRSREGLYLLLTTDSHLMYPATLPVTGNLAMSSDGNPVLKLFVAIRATQKRDEDRAGEGLVAYDQNTAGLLSAPQRWYYDRDGEDGQGAPHFVPLVGDCTDQQRAYRTTTSAEMAELIY